MIDQICWRTEVSTLILETLVFVKYQQKLFSGQSVQPPEGDVTQKICSKFSVLLSNNGIYVAEGT